MRVSQCSKHCEAIPILGQPPNLLKYVHCFSIFTYNRCHKALILCSYERNRNFFKKTIDKQCQNCYNFLSRLTAKYQMACGCSSMARISAFQADCVGSIPITRFLTMRLQLSWIEQLPSKQWVGSSSLSRRAQFFFAANVKLTTWWVQFSRQSARLWFWMSPVRVRLPTPLFYRIGLQPSR